MKKLFIIFCICGLLPLAVIAQFEAEPQLFVFGAAGDIDTNDEGFQMSWTLGEAIIFDAFGEPSNASMLAGYQQGVSQTIILVPTWDLAAPFYEIRLFPNPSADLIYIDFGDFPKDNVRMTIIDSGGKIVGHTEARTRLEVGNYPEGIYYLVLKSDLNKITKPFIISK